MRLGQLELARCRLLGSAGKGKVAECPAPRHAADRVVWQADVTPPARGQCRWHGRRVVEAVALAGKVGLVAVMFAIWRVSCCAGQR